MEGPLPTALFRSMDIKKQPPSHTWDKSCTLLRYHPNSPLRTLSPAHCLTAKRSCCNVQPRLPYFGNPVQFALAGPFVNAYAPCSHQRTALWSASADITTPAQRFLCFLCTLLSYHTFPTLSRGNYSFFRGDLYRIRRKLKYPLTNAAKYVTIG